MAYKCPRCGEPVQRGYSASAQLAGGLVGALFAGAFGSFECKTCGKIPRNEFSSEDQGKMAVGSVLMVVGAVVLLVLVLWLLSVLNK